MPAPALNRQLEQPGGQAMPDVLPDNPRQNRILAALPAKEYARLLDDLVVLPAGCVLHEAGDSLEFAYFPTTAIVSMIFSTESGSSTELAMTGNDGVVGIALVLGGESSTHGSAVQKAGVAYRLRAEVLRWELDQGGLLQRLSLRYAQALLTQTAQGVACYRHHALDKHLCRWLLLRLGLQAGNQLDATQELIASKLGVRREGVTEAAGKLQAAGLIQYRRGHITVTDRAGLEARACECFGVVESEYRRLFSLDPAQRVENRARPNPATLRKRAEARLQQRKPAVPFAAWDAERLQRELQVHQIELELHNEELRHAYQEADALRAQFADIYDFAPVGYFTLNSLGVILQVNLAGAILLDIKRSEHSRYRFVEFIKAEFLPVFSSFLVEVLEAKSKQKCELALVANRHRSESVIRIEAVADESGSECRMVVSDITLEKQAEIVLESQQESKPLQFEYLPRR